MQDIVALFDEVEDMVLGEQIRTRASRHSPRRLGVSKNPTLHVIYFPIKHGSIISHCYPMAQDKPFTLLTCV